MSNVSLRARQLVRQSPEAAFAMDEANRIFAWNDHARELLGFARTAVLGRDSAEVIAARDTFGNQLCPHHCALHLMAKSQQAIETFTLQVKNAGGHFVLVFTSVEVVGNLGHDGYSLVFTVRPERRRQTTDALLERLLHRRLAQEVAEPNGLHGRDLLITERQRQVLKLLADGKNTAQIAASLHVSVNTVRHHLQNVLENLHCHSQAEAVAVAIRRQLI